MDLALAVSLDEATAPKQAQKQVPKQVPKQAPKQPVREAYHPAEVSSTPATTYSEEDFPALGGGAVAPPVPVPDPGLEKKKKQAVETIAKRLAKVNKLNVQESEADFPVLGGSTTKSSAAPYGGLASLADWIKTSSATNSSRQPLREPTPKQPAPRKFSIDEFPTLGAGGASRTSTTPQRGNQPAPRKFSMDEFPILGGSGLSRTSTPPQQAKRGKPPSSNSAVRGKPPNPKGWQMKQHSLDTKVEDFPPLGTGSPKSQHSVVVNLKKKPLLSPSHRTRSLEDFGPVLTNVNQSSSSESLGPSGHSSNESLVSSSICVKTKVRKMSADYSSGSSGADERPASGSTGLIRKNRPPGLQLRLSASQENLSSPADETAMDGHPDARLVCNVQSQEEFPNLPQKSRPRFARSISVQLSPTSENFPATITITTPPPSSARDPPPGFGHNRNAVPPGFSATVPYGSATVTITSKSSTPPMIMTNGTNTSVTCNSYSYAQPSDYKDRNQMLITNVRDALENNSDRFTEFKTMSSQFRQGSVSATQYYEKCRELFGQSKFSQIFPELLVLLPDIRRQEELLAAHNVYQKQEHAHVLNISRSSRAAPWAAASAFTVCSLCHQVLANRDVTSHQSTHSLEEDFPALGVR